jgi:murein L,D-transpeptidase YafK
MPHRLWIFHRLFLPVFVLILSFLCHASDLLPAHARADQVVVNKKAHTLILLADGKVLKEYRVALGGDPVGPKTRHGDHKTPEGTYTLDRRNDHSQFYRSIHISYPNAEDRARAHKLGAAPGGDIMLHGLPNHYGCIAVTNEEIDEIWRAVPDGTPIEIRP